MKKKLLSLVTLLTACVGLNAQVIFNVRTPANLSGNYPFSLATTGWGTPDMNLSVNAVEELLVFVEPDSLACTAPTNVSALAGKIAVLYRGSCEFGAKAKFAQDAGAIGVIIINNQGAPVAMGAGAQGLNVTVPVIMISTDDGALLKSEIKAGNVTAFIGSKLGNFPNDLGYKSNLVLYPQNAARPLSISSVPGDYTIDAGLWLYNFGSANQTGASITAAITQTGGGTIFAETQGNLNILAGDSVFIAFAPFSPAWTVGEYKLSYTISVAGTDGDPSDNSSEAIFSINNSIYSYAPINLATGLPKATTFNRSGNPAPTSHCVAFRDPKANNLNLEGFSFAARAVAPVVLTDEFLEIDIFEWNDVFADNNTPPTYDNLVSIASMEHTYTGNDNDSVIKVSYTGPAYTFKVNQRYLACVKVLRDSIAFGYTDHIDYDGNLSNYLQPITALRSNGTWFSGFTEGTAAMGLHSTSNGNSIKDFTVNSDVVPFPNPSNQYVIIPFATGNAKSAEISVMDVNGKLVSSTTAVAEGKNLRVNTTNLSVGSYLFNVTLDNGQTSSFRVVIGR